MLCIAWQTANHAQHMQCCKHMSSYPKLTGAGTSANLDHYHHCTHLRFALPAIAVPAPSQSAMCRYPKSPVYLKMMVCNILTFTHRGALTSSDLQSSLTVSSRIVTPVPTESPSITLICEGRSPDNHRHTSEDCLMGWSN